MLCGRLPRTTTTSKYTPLSYYVLRLTTDIHHPSSQGNEDDEDIVDSDFSIDENDEPVSDQEDETGGRKKSKRVGVVTKAYKEPPAKKTVPAAKPKAAATPKKSPVKSASTSKTQQQQSSPRYTVFDSGRKSFRKSTALKTAATQIRVNQRTEEEKKKKKYIKVTEYIPTQEELLEEAAETEKENTKSLEKFMRLEMEKKRSRPTKRKSAGPIIRYHSMSLPLIEDLDGKAIDFNTSPVKVEPMDVDADDQAASAETDPRPAAPKRSRQTQRAMNAIKNGPRYERTFITFENDVHDRLFDEVFKKKRKAASAAIRSERSKTCPITKLPARYFDPVTKVAYRSVAAFKVIREAYYRHLEQRGNPENPQVAKWLLWRRQYNEQRINKAKTRLPSGGSSN